MRKCDSFIAIQAGGYQNKLLWEQESKPTVWKTIQHHSTYFQNTLEPPNNANSSWFILISITGEGQISIQIDTAL